MTDTRKSVAGKTVPGEQKVPVAGKRLPGEKTGPRGPGGKTIPKAQQPTDQRKSVAGKSLPGEQRVPVAGKRLPGDKTVPRGHGGKTIPKAQQPTKRQLKLATVRDPGAGGHERGIVCGSGDGLLWKDESGEDTTWIPAIYHNDIRQKLLAKANGNGQLAYDHPRKHGYLASDETAFLLSQQHWGPDRSTWHHIPDDLLNRLDRLDYKGKDYDLSYMYDEDSNRIVLDKDNHPIIDYEDIPSVLSSNFGMQEEGYLLEAIRRTDMRIRRTDFLARMPWLRKSTEKGKVLPIFTLSSIGNREYRWRKDNAIVAWTQRSGSKNLRAYIVSKLSEDGRTNNSTRELVGGLTKEEKQEAERPNKGVMMSKAGKRLLTDDKRREREIKSSQVKDGSSTKRQSKKRKAPAGSDDSDNAGEDDDLPNHRAKRVKLNECQDTTHKDNLAMTEGSDQHTLHSGELLSPSHLALGTLQGQPLHRNPLTMETAPSSRERVEPASTASSSGQKRPRETSLEAPEEGDGTELSRPKRQKVDFVQQQHDSDSQGREVGPHTMLSTLAPYQSDFLTPFQPLPLDGDALPGLPTSTLPPQADLQNLGSGIDKPLSSDDVDDSGSHTVTNTLDTSPSNSSQIYGQPAEDYRFKQPQTEADAMQIDEALSLTRNSFTDIFGSEVFGNNGPPTACYDSYAEQYSTLQNHAASLQNVAPETFHLDHWGAWLGGFDKWRGTSISNEDFLGGMETRTDKADEEDDVPANDALFEEFTSGIL